MRNLEICLKCDKLLRSDNTSFITNNYGDLIECGAYEHIWWFRTGKTFSRDYLPDECKFKLERVSLEKFLTEKPHKACKFIKKHQTA